MVDNADESTSGDLWLIPRGEADARVRLAALTSVDIGLASRARFLQGWHALFWLFPGLHPDGFDEDWVGEFEAYRPLAAEAFKRAEAGELTDGELYPTDAAQARLAGERAALMRGEGAPLIPGDELVVLQGPDGKYLGRTAAEEICWVDDVSKAHKYWRKLDAVDAQVSEVKRQYSIDWVIVKLHPTA
ncbi:MAG: hypothetical protein KDN05_01130 [Verrucomicrobiae bacterium]|nr:hypothetical protein [Verrucomicrobiae bacterium]